MDPGTDYQEIMARGNAPCESACNYVPFLWMLIDKRQF